MRPLTTPRTLLALLAAAISFGMYSQAQAETLRIGYQKYGTLVLLKARGTLEKRLAEQGVELVSGDAGVLRAALADDTRRWGDVIREGNIKLE